MLKTLHFVRHGQSIANVGGVTMENHLITLTDVGQQQAWALASLLPAQAPAVFVSPFARTQATAHPYCTQTARQPQVLNELHEFETIDFTLLEGMTGAQRQPITQAYWDEANPDKRMGARAETFAEFDQRVTAFAALQMPRLPDGAVLFGHGMWISLLCWKLLGFTAADGLGMKAFRQFQLGFPMPNGALLRVQEITPNRWTFQADESAMRQMVAIASQPASAT